MHACALVTGIVLSALMTVAGAAQAATFVYVSNAEDGDIGMYTLAGRRLAAARRRASRPGKMVMPMSVSPDKRFLVAAVRSKPFSAVSLQHRPRHRRAQAARQRRRSRRASRTSRSTRPGATCSARPTAAHLVSVNPVGNDGKCRRAERR